ncbi:hypothetical protein AAFF_G00006960 [Aldrovandia affinis]|uniref:Uncharacterized protein n=1 Tax=Aldrovandia affinis TaxID=143900 RepID=A0AAD7T6C8_9TELE|nr:hypothetical protein AAFF_G00006960 [Aldrovandia affinis]
MERMCNPPGRQQKVLAECGAGGSPRRYFPLSSVHTMPLPPSGIMTKDNKLSLLDNGVFSMLKSLEVLNLQGNRINSTEVGVFTPLTSLALLNLAHNHLSTIRFKTFLSIHTYSASTSCWQT